MSENLRVLLIEDNPADIKLIREALPETGPLSFQIEAVPTLSQALVRLENKGVDLVLLDLGLPDSKGLQAFHKLLKIASDIPIIILTEDNDQDLAASAVRQGAQDFLVKGEVDSNRLMRALRYAVERKLAEEACKASELRYRRLFETAKDGILILDAETGMIADVNPFLMEMLGYSHAQFVGKTIWDLGFLKDIVANQSNFLELQRKGYIRYECLPLQTASGQRIDVEFVSNVYLVDKSKVIQCNIRDITERKLADEQIRTLARFPAENPSPVLRVKADSTILYTNEPGARLLILWATAQGRKLPEFWHEPIASALSSGARKEIEFICGQEAYDFVLAPVKAEDYVNIYGFNVTPRKKAEEGRLRLEEQLRHVQKMEGIGQLAGGVAHDFNNLLFGIVGNSELIKRRCHNDKAIRDLAQQICDIALKGGTLTRQLLTFARKGHYVISLLDIRQALTNVVNILKHSVDKRISIEIKVGAQPLLVRTDAAQLENAILNLALNARDAMPKGGRLVLEAGVARLDEAYCSKLAFECLPDDYVEITVSDTGTGMDKETQARIFEPFFTTKEAGKGTGLGLSSVFGFAKQMHGYVHVYSEKGRGSIFKLRLPMSREKEVEAKEEESVMVKGSGHILLVEDEQSIRDLVRRFLAELEYSVACCADGEEGVRYFRENPGKTDLVILDLIMPKLGGYDCFMELRKIDPSIPVIISSGFGIDTEVQKMLDAGAKGFIQKPYKFTELSKLIAETIRKRRTDKTHECQDHPG